AAPAPLRHPRATGSPNPLTSSDPIGGGRFTPGQILAERYRIVALAGRGGMGEVFRAEDLTLGQIVAMKFLPERLSQDARALSPDKATEIARQICAGLAAAHERGVIHRDLKPANIMLDGADKIRITDFGLAGIAASIQGEEARAGTPANMAPEQLAGKQVTTR